MSTRSRDFRMALIMEVAKLLPEAAKRANERLNAIYDYTEVHASEPSHHMLIRCKPAQGGAEVFQVRVSEVM